MTDLENESSKMNSLWSNVAPGIWLFRDSCHVYALETPIGMLLINAGSGRWLEHLDALPKKPVALACTHYFRDHTAGAVAAAHSGIPVYVPEGEQSIFADPVRYFQQQETYIIYDNLWNLYAPIESIPVAGVLRDYDKVTLAGIALEIIPLPGVTMTQIGLGVTLATGQRVVFCGEAIHSPGRLARIAPLQYNYNDLPGAIQCYFSAKELREWKPDILLPSLGGPMTVNADAALTELQKNLRSLVSVRPGMLSQIDYLESEPLEKITEHVWRDRHSFANTWYLISKSGKVLALDYGYHQTTSAAWVHAAAPVRRRALLHGLDGLKRQFGIDRIDVVLVSHFHDDHVCGIPVLQRLYGTECWAAENFADLLEHPEAHCFPCNWPVAVPVDRRLPIDQSFTWEEYTFTLHPMSGHTRFSALIGFEADGKRFAHTGDQYFFEGDFQTEAGFAGVHRNQNQVYRNGALLNGYEVSGKWILEQRPDIVLQGHQSAMFTDDAFFDHIAAWSQDYSELARQIMPLSDDQTHFDLDNWGGWIWPYRTHHSTVGPIQVRVTVRNPLSHAATLEVRLVGSQGWVGESIRLQAEAHAEVSAMLSILPAGPCYRQPFAVELTAGGHCFGQVAEAFATIGQNQF